MMRLLRCLSFFAALLLGVFSGVSYAETIAAQGGYIYSTSGVDYGPAWLTPSTEVCNIAVVARLGSLYRGQYGTAVYPTACRQIRVSDSAEIGTQGFRSTFFCPSGFTGPALINGVQSCTSVDCPTATYPYSDSQSATIPSTCSCPSGSAWYPYNGCRQKCATPANEKLGGGWYYVIKTGSASSCVQGCSATKDTGTFYDNPDGTTLAGMSSTGWACDGGSVAPAQADSALDPTKAKKPNCAPSEGVLTSSSGTVACVPEGTPTARKPTVQATESKNTAADNTVINTTKTTTTDPATGAKETVTTTTTTSPSGSSSTSTNSQSSGAGGTGDNSGNEPGQCAKEPDSPTCKTGTVKDKGEFTEGQNADLDEAKAALRAKFAEIQAAASAMFDSSASSGSGSLPCFSPVQVLGHSFSVCFTQYSSQLAPIGGYVILAASLLAVFIVLRR